jgi:hypothetical protein
MALHRCARLPKEDQYTAGNWLNGNDKGRRSALRLLLIETLESYQTLRLLFTSCEM